MRKIWISAVFGAVALLGLPAMSYAGPGGGHGGGGHGGGGHGGGHGGGFSGGHGGYGHGGYGHGGYGYGHGGYGRYGYGGYGYGGLGLYSGLYGYGYGSPYYGSSYYEPAYDYSSPSAVAPAAYYSPDTSSIGSPADNPNPNAAMLQLRVPENAEVWFEGDKTSQTGSVRHFVSPSLEPGKTFTYDVRARWTDASGQPVDRTKQVKVQAGARVGVDFNRP
jgi:uncharacterized protein (TIGR03000 family)